MNKDDIIRMAKSVGIDDESWQTVQALRGFADLVAAAEREKVAQWMIQRSYATGHGDTTEDLLAELEWQIAENWNRAMINGVETEREACAKVCDKISDDDGFEGGYADNCAKAIRARGQG